MKLEIESVEFKNFLSFGSSIQSVDLRRGVNVVLGRDVEKRKSNGAGKSSFLETVPFALFGKVQRDIKKSQIVNWKNGSNCEVVCNFRISEDIYQVVRSIKPDNFEIYKNSVLLDKPPHVREYQKQLDDILGINYQTFMSLVHSNINSSQKILAMRKPEKRKFLERVFNLEVYSQIRERANEKMRTMEEKSKLINSEIEQKEWAIKESTDRIKNLNKEIEHLNETKKELDDYDITYSLKECEEKTSEYEKALEDISKQIDDIRLNKLSPIMKELEFIEREKQANAETEKYRKRLADFVEKFGEIDDIKAKEDDMKKQLSEIKTRERDGRESLSEYRAMMAENDSEKKHYKEIVMKFKDGKCPTCGQAVEDQKKIVEAKVQYRKTVIYGDKLKEQFAAADAELLTVEEEIRDKENEINRMSEVKEKYHRLKSLAGKKIEMTGGEREKKKLLEQKEEVSKLIDDLDSKAYKLGPKYEEWSDRLRISQIVEKLQERIKNEEKAIKSFSRMIEEEKGSMIKKSEKIETMNKEKNKIVSVMDYLDYIKEICKDENIKQYAISSLMPYLNQQTNHYLSEVGYGFFAVIDRWLEAEIKGPSITDGSYYSLSGGESRGIDLALQFALLDIARMQSILWPDILIMDEILDSSVDSTGIEKLMEIIRVKQSDDESKVFVISHREEVEDFVADNVYTIIKEGGFSRVE